MDSYFDDEPGQNDLDRYGPTLRVYARLDTIEGREGEDESAELDALIVSGNNHIALADTLRSIGDASDWRREWRRIIQINWYGRRSPEQQHHIDEFLGLFRDIRLVSLRLTIGLREKRDLLEQPGQWHEMELTQDGTGSMVSVFNSLFGAPRLYHLTAWHPLPANDSAQLAAAFTMQDWPTTPHPMAAIAMSQVEASYWAAYDVGQGSANALLDDGGEPTLFHDLGCGALWNAGTRPAGFAWPLHTQSPVVLSHWDSDHWSGAIACDPTHNFLNRRWVAPHDPSAGIRHIAFARKILLAGGHLNLLAQGPWRISWTTAQGRWLSLFRPAGNNRNDAGIALEVRKSHRSAKAWLLPGDASYDALHQHSYLAPHYLAMAVPHHGSGHSCANPPAPLPGEYHRLVYSFGPDNTYGHPANTAIQAHVQANWQNHSGWNGTGQPATGEPTRATASNPPGQHRGSVLVGWTTPNPPNGNWQI